MAYCRARVASGRSSVAFLATALVAACGSKTSGTDRAGIDGSESGTASHSTFACDDTLKSAFRPDNQTTVTLVHLFKAGDPLALPDTPASPPPPVASNDTCLVKLNVGPGNPGPASAPSTSPGIGIEIWLPASANWNGRIRSVMDGGWAGSPLVSSVTNLRSDVGVWTTEKGYVSSITDGGHSSKTGQSTGSFTLNPDGSINTALLTDLSTRALHEM